MHLTGDVITVGGIHPFLPFSRRRSSLSRLRVASTLANTVFLSLGVLAMGTVIFALSPRSQERSREKISPDSSPTGGHG